MKPGPTPGFLVLGHEHFFFFLSLLKQNISTMANFTNKLINETSPYLLQHAHNPVDWHPWNDQTLQKAIDEDKMLLISIGYSACHWCHVMEHESFEDVEVAAYMNTHYVCVKVDREERPDIDQVYMDAVQIMSGRGGWPLNCIALPDGRMVYGGTYYRKNDWLHLLKQLHELFTYERDKLVSQAETIMEGISKLDIVNNKTESPIPSIHQITNSIESMSKGFDTDQGGFNGAPKFPMPVILEYLLYFTQYTQHQNIKQHIDLTLKKMALGGIFDHIGGGFARYSVDTEWHIPHFEKMLYDNAQLISIYAKAYQQNNNELFKMAVYESIAFIERELTSPDGAFYSAIDADSQGVEGKFYVWTTNELQEILGNDFQLIARYYSLSTEGNWEKGLNVLKSVDLPENFAAKNEIPVNSFLSLLETTQTKLLKYRNKRQRPATDDKIITSWNAIMIKALCDAYQVFENSGFLKTAINAANFIIEKLTNEQHSLWRTHKLGQSKISAFLDDYAFVCEAFIALYQSSFDEKWLTWAKYFTDYAIEHFLDSESGFFFYTSDNDTPLTARKKEVVDNVIPSSNAVMAQNLFMLSKYYSNMQYATTAENMLKKMTFEVINYGRFYSKWASILVRYHYCNKELTIIGPQAMQYYSAIKNIGKTNMIYAVSENESNLPIFSNRYCEGKTAVYFCENNTCKQPVYSITDAIKIIEE